MAVLGLARDEHRCKRRGDERPKIPIPRIIRLIAIVLPSGLTGNLSPYPTVVTVATAHHSASAKLWMLASGFRCSTCQTIAAANRTSKPATITPYFALDRFTTASDWSITRAPMTAILPSRIVRKARSAGNIGRSDDQKVDDVVLHEGRPIHSDGPSGHELGGEDEPQRPFDDGHHVCPSRRERDKDRDEEQQEGCDDDTEHRPSRLPLERLEGTWLPAETQRPVLDYLLVSHALTP